MIFVIILKSTFLSEVEHLFILKNNKQKDVYYNYSKFYTSK